jgi:hypothetical protein
MAYATGNGLSDRRADLENCCGPARDEFVQAFLRRVSGIERGAECARYESLLSALADGEATPEQLATLRPHMRTCLSCGARLREFRSTPEGVAALLPPTLLVAADGGSPLRNLVECLVGPGDRFHSAAELATG